MIKDITGTKLMSGNFGKDCLGDGRHFDKNGKQIECCCDECGYLMCCTEENFHIACADCVDFRCPRCKNKFSAFLKSVFAVILHIFK